MLSSLLTLIFLKSDNPTAYTPLCIFFHNFLPLPTPSFLLKIIISLPNILSSVHILPQISSSYVFLIAQIHKDTLIKEFFYWFAAWHKRN